MRTLWVWLLGVGLLFGLEASAEFELKRLGYGGADGESLLDGSGQLSYASGSFEALANVEYLYSSQYASRRYITLQELYGVWEAEAYRFELGKAVHFWGELEGFNIIDIYNQKNDLKDPFEKGAKLGSAGATLSRYGDGAVWEIGARLYEADHAYPEADEPYYPFGPAQYDETLRLSENRDYPTAYVMYSMMSEAVAESESRVVVQHGYDTKRALVPVGAGTLAQYAYLADKVMLSSNIVAGAMIVKLEAAVTDPEADAPVGEYRQLGFGAEYGLYPEWADVTLYGEYYRYDYDEDEGQTDIAQVYDHDLFLAVRLAANDVRDSTLKAGVLYDPENREALYRLQARMRLADGLVAKLEGLKADPARGTLLESIGADSRWMLGLQYRY